MQQIMTNVLQEYLDIRDNIAELEGKKKELEQQIMSMPEKEHVLGMNKIIRVTRRSVKLKKDISNDVIKEKFPEFITEEVKEKIDMKGLQQVPEAHDLLELSETSFVQVKEIKEEF